MKTNLKLASIFRDHMVVQQGLPIRVFGEGSGEITVRLADQAETITADGDWLAELAPMTVGGPYTLTVESADTSIEINDVMVGEVILCSGQSNMQLKMFEEVTPASDYIDDDLLRTFACERPEKVDKITPASGWVRCRKENVPDWSALAYHMGVGLRKKFGCAIGMIVSVQGASVIQSWIDEDVITGTELDLPTELLLGDHKHPIWQSWNGKGWLYRNVLSQVIPYTSGLVVWYQGESNTHKEEAGIYLDLLDMMITDWRKKFRNEALPFVVVQLADFKKGAAWAMVQEAQLAAQDKIPHVRTVKCADVCESDDIHPPTKWKLAERIVDVIDKGGF